MIGAEGLDALDWARIAVRAVGLAAALLAAGSALFLRGHRPDAATARATRRLAVAAAVAAAALAGGVVLGEAVFLTGGDVAAALDPFLLGVVLDSPIGDRHGLRLLGLALVATLAFGPRWRLLAVVGAVAVAASFALSGHTLREPRPALAALVTLHVAAAAWWVGGLAPLHRAAGRAPAAEAAALAHAFGRGALVAVGVLVVAGASLLILIGGSPPSLLETPWGRLMALKLLAVAGLLALAALNRLRLTPGLARGAPGAAGALRRSIAVEALAIAAILLATSAMTVIGAPTGEGA